LALYAGKIIPSWDRFGFKVCAWCCFWVRFLQRLVGIRWISARMSHQRAVLEHCVNVRRNLPRLRHRCQCPTVPPWLRDMPVSDGTAVAASLVSVRRYRRVCVTDASVRRTLPRLRHMPVSDGTAASASQMTVSDGTPVAASHASVRRYPVAASHDSVRRYPRGCVTASVRRYRRGCVTDASVRRYRRVCVTDASVRR